MSSNDQLWLVKGEDGKYSIYWNTCCDNPYDWERDKPWKIAATRAEAEQVVKDVNAEYGEVWIDEEHMKELNKGLSDMCKFDENGCAYIRFKPFFAGQVKRDIHISMSGMVFIFDFDEKNEVVGVEILK